MIQENPLLPGAEALTMCVEMQLPTSHTYCSAETFVKLEPDLHVDGAAVSNSVRRSSIESLLIVAMRVLSDA